MLIATCEPNVPHYTKQNWKLWDTQQTKMGPIEDKTIASTVEENNKLRLRWLEQYGPVFILQHNIGFIGLSHTPLSEPVVQSAPNMQ